MPGTRLSDVQHAAVSIAFHRLSDGETEAEVRAYLRAHQGFAGLSRRQLDTIVEHGVRDVAATAQLESRRFRGTLAEAYPGYREEQLVGVRVYLEGIGKWSGLPARASVTMNVPPGTTRAAIIDEATAAADAGLWIRRGTFTEPIDVTHSEIAMTQYGGIENPLIGPPREYRRGV